MLGLIAAGAGVVLLVVLLIGAFQRAQQLQQQLAMAQQQIAQLESQNRELTHQYDSLQAERNSLEDKIGSVRAQLASVNAELERSQAGLKELKLKADVLEEERTLLQTQVLKLTDERDQSQQRVTRLEQEKAESQRSLSRTRERLALVDRDYRKLQQRVAELESMPHPGVDVVTSIDSQAGAASAPTGAASSAAPSAIPGAVELPPIVVRKDQAGMTSVVRGRLVEVNIPHRFVVVDRGSDDGVRVGMSFDLVRGSTTVGRATAVRVHPKLSACDVVAAKTPGPVQIGDLAVQSTR